MADFEIKDGVAIIPEGTTEIPEWAFGGCSELNEVVIPSGVTKIGRGAFGGCCNLKEIMIPSTVIEIDSFAFEGCASLTEVVIPSSVIEIGFGLFDGCDALEKIVVEKGNPKYDSRDGCNAIIETATNKLINKCNSTIAPLCTIEVGSDYFPDCSTLTKIVIPEGTIKIGSFSGCTNLKEIVIPASVTEISSNAFSDCTALEKIVVEEGNPKYDSREACNAIIETATNKLICGCKSTVIPASVKSRGYFPKGVFRINSKGRFLKTDRKKAKRNYHNYTVKSYEEAKKLAYNIWSYHDSCCYIMDEVIEKKNVLKIKFYLPCIMCDDEGNYSDEEFYIYEIFKIKLRYNKGIKREPLLDLGD